MYLPRHFRMDDDADVDGLLSDLTTVELITFDGVRPVASLMPMLWDRVGRVGPDQVQGRLLGHLARANPQWSSIQPGSQALAIATGPQTYVSPSWYPSTAEHGRVVPTWNYVSVHLTGAMIVHQDSGWLREVVGRLTRRHEDHRPEPWTVEDPPAGFVATSLKAIVGIELLVTSVEAKAKLSQNRDPADRAGVIDGLGGEHSPDARRVAALMQAPGTRDTRG